MIPFEADTDVKHGLRRVGKKFVFSINGVDAEDAGLYQVEVDGVKIFTTEFKRKMKHQTYYVHTLLQHVHSAIQSKTTTTSCPVTGNARYYVVL